MKNKTSLSPRTWPGRALAPLRHAWHKSFWNKFALVFFAFLILITGSAYGIARWYMWERRNESTRAGVTFISDYALYLGVDPQSTLRAVFEELKPSQVRLVSYWKNIEAVKGMYNFSNLDWQIKMAAQYNIKISLAVGLRQPRWPECHMPHWALGTDKSQWYPELKKFMTATIERYKSSPALESYQLENEFFLTVFGECPDFSRDRLVDEYNLVKQLDPHHKVIVSRSNNAVGFPIYEPTPDEFGVSVYKRVWDKTITKRYFEYPFPAWFYGFLAGGGKLISGKDMIIHELQAEAWVPEGYNISTAPTEELYKSMNPERLKGRFEYAKASGVKHMDLWGVEWWYAMKVTRGEPGLWETGKEEFSKIREENIKHSLR